MGDIKRERGAKNVSNSFDWVAFVLIRLEKRQAEHEDIWEKLEALHLSYKRKEITISDLEMTSSQVQ